MNFSQFWSELALVFCVKMSHIQIKELGLPIEKIPGWGNFCLKVRL